MKTIKNKPKENTDTDKALAKAAEVFPKKPKEKIEKLVEIIPDTMIAEKDEVKNAEEKMRQTQKKRTGNSKGGD